MFNNRVFKGTLLIAGTSMGGGMLGLPVEMSLGGFIPSIFIYLACWLLMACTGLLFLEVVIWMKKECNIISMAEATLGIYGKVFAWGLYIFMFYSLTLAYIAGCGRLISETFPNSFSLHVAPLLFVMLFAPFVYAGARVVGRVNTWMMAALFVFFFAFLAVGWKHINPEFLLHSNWRLSLIGLPVAFTAFGYQGTVPTLIHYLHHDPKKARFAILLGSFIPFAAYIIWQALILGVVPVDGIHGLAAAKAMDENAVAPMIYFTKNYHLDLIGKFFAFFAMLTSFFGVTLGLQDFLADGLKIKKTPRGRLLLSLLIFIPPLVIVYIKPQVFLAALGYAGGFGSALLLGFLPIMMVWSLRYHLQHKSHYTLSGGKWLLLALLLFIFFEIGVQLSIISGFFPL